MDLDLVACGFRQHFAQFRSYTFGLCGSLNARGVDEWEDETRDSGQVAAFQEPDQFTFIKRGPVDKVIRAQGNNGYIMLCRESVHGLNAFGRGDRIDVFAVKVVNPLDGIKAGRGS